MSAALQRLFRLERGEGPRLLAFALFGFLLQMGLGIGFSAGDAAFLANAGAARLPLVFLLTPLVMLGYTAAFSFLLLRSSIERMVDATLALLIAGGVLFWALLGSRFAVGQGWALYLALKLYLAMWYIGLYSLFWNFTDAYFDIQDAKRLFPLLAAGCALGTAAGGLFVGALSDVMAMRHFMLAWAGIALLAVPVARVLCRRWRPIAESEAAVLDGDEAAGGSLRAVAAALGRSRYTLALSGALFVTLLLTNLSEYQYATVLQAGRSEAELAGLFGTLYAATNLFNLVVCLFVFTRLVAWLGVRNVALIQPLAYFAVFGLFFVAGGTGAAIAAFVAYHGVLTSIEYNNQNLLFNAVPAGVKRPLRTLVEGLCEPLASLLAGGFLLLAADQLDLRETSGIGLIVALLLIGVVLLVRQLYGAAMAANMRRGWLDFSGPPVRLADLEPAARAGLAGAAGQGDPLAAALLAGDGADAAGLRVRHGLPAAPDPADADAAPALAGTLAGAADGQSPAERLATIALLGTIADGASVAALLAPADALPPRERRALAAALVAVGETAIPPLIAALEDAGAPLRTRSVAARALARLSYAHFDARLDGIVRRELGEAAELLAASRPIAAVPATPALVLLARAQRERVGAALDHALELLALGGRLPDFDLLVVSLHSANPKVRGNAIEAVESGLDRALFHQIAPLLTVADAAPAGGGAPPVSLEQAVDRAFATGHGIERVAAAEALRERLGPAGFAPRAVLAAGPGLPPDLREHLRACLGLAGAERPRRFDRIVALARRADVGGATLEALGALADRARDEPPAGQALADAADGTPFWIAAGDVAAVAARFPDLALVRLRNLDRRRAA